MPSRGAESIEGGEDTKGIPEIVASVVDGS